MCATQSKVSSSPVVARAVRTSFAASAPRKQGRCQMMLLWRLGGSGAAASIRLASWLMELDGPSAVSCKLAVTIRPKCDHPRGSRWTGDGGQPLGTGSGANRPPGRVGKISSIDRSIRSLRANRGKVTSKAKVTPDPLVIGWKSA